MTTSMPPSRSWVRTLLAKPGVRFALGVSLAVLGYFFWQVVGAFVAFFLLGSGAGHQNGVMVVATVFLAVHVGLLGVLRWRRVLQAAWWSGLVNVGISLGLFSRTVWHPWYQAPRESTYQRYTFTRGTQRYRLTLEQPGHGFDLSDVTDQQQGITTSLLMGDY
jgi:hypothetical protein